MPQNGTCSTRDMRPTAVLVSVALIGCTSTEYSYVPAENASATLEGQAAADYAVPPAAPAGDVRLATFGVAELQPRGPHTREHHMAAIHLRMVIANDGNDTWTFDTRDQRLDLEGRGMSAPALATADRAGDTPPVVTIPPAGKRTVDLFFPLPSDLDGASNLPSFDAVWRITVAPDETIVERTPFERIVLEEAPPVDGYDDALWPYWYDPYYAGWGVVLPEDWHGRGWGRSGWGVHAWGHPHFWHGGHAGVHGGGFHGGGFHGGGRR